MDSIQLIKLLAIGITIFYIFQDSERPSITIGWLFISAFGLTFFDNSMIITGGVFLYLATILIGIILTLSKAISVENRTLLILFFLIALVNGTTVILRLPNYGLFIYMSIAGILIYVYFQLKHRTVNILTVTSIPLVDFIITLSKLFS